MGCPQSSRREEQGVRAAHRARVHCSCPVMGSDGCQGHQEGLAHVTMRTGVWLDTLPGPVTPEQRPRRLVSAEALLEQDIERGERTRSRHP